MPARTPWSPGRIPAGFTFFGSFPEGEIKGMALAALFSISCAAARSLLLLIGIAAAELAVILGFGDIEVDIAIGAVGGAFGFQFADQLLNAIDAAVALGMRSAGRMLSRPISISKASILRSLTASIELPSSLARLRILSSMSVKF